MILYIWFWKPDTCEQRQKPQQNDPLKPLIRSHFKLIYQQCPSLSHTSLNHPDDVYWCWHQLYDQVLDAHVLKIIVTTHPSPAWVYITNEFRKIITDLSPFSHLCQKSLKCSSIQESAPGSEIFPISSCSLIESITVAIRLWWVLRRNGERCWMMGKWLVLFLWTHERASTLYHKEYGADERTATIIKDYFSDRQQRVKIAAEYSNWNNISTGIAQGSILGPLIFNIFTLDEKTDLRMFASWANVL